jgi:hypothetical protein
VLLSIQFPLTDIRRFLHVNTGYISQPDWPAPLISPHRPGNAPFVRGFGQVEVRKLGGLAFWGEELVCDAPNFVGWRGPDAYSFHQNRVRLPIELAFRRLFFDGAAVGKFELGIATGRRSSFRLNSAEFRLFLRWFLDHPVTVPAISKGARKDGRSKSTIIQIGRYLEHAYLRATTRSVWSARNKPGKDWVCGGTPVVFMHLQSPSESAALASLGMRSVNLEQWGVQISCGLVESRVPNIPIWVIRARSEYNKTVARQLRLGILRLHAEHESLRWVLHNLHNSRIKIAKKSPATERLEAYLNESTRRLLRTSSTLEKLGRALIVEDNEPDPDQDDVTEMARSVLDRLWPGQAASLESKLKQLAVRRNIARKVQDYVEINLAKYDIHDNPQVTIIDMLNLVNPQDNSHEQVTQLLDKLTALEDEAAKRAQTPEQHEAVQKVREAKEDAKKGDRSGVVSKLRAAGEWIGQIAKELGASVIAKVIEGQLGLG